MPAFKQDMPPPGGYAPIIYERVPLKKGLSAVSKLCIGLALIVVSYFDVIRVRDAQENEKIEMRCSKLALRPMLEAETDRALLKQLKRNRDAEENIMKDVKGWEVGKWKHSPVYLSLDPDEYFKPTAEEFYAHADFKLLKESSNVVKMI